jgi:hypothetical protein
MSHTASDLETARMMVLRNTLECECGATGWRLLTLRTIDDGSIAQYPMADRTSDDHSTFDHVTIEQDHVGGEWHDFNGGAAPICPACWVRLLAKGQFVTDHVVKTCHTGECAEMREWVATNPTATAEAKAFWKADS